MVNEEKVRIMTAIAYEEKEHGSELLNDAFFYKNDYVKMHVLSVIWNYTIGYFLILILIALYNMDYLLLNFVKINYLYAGMALLFSYLLIIIVSILISKIYYQDKYDKEQETMQKYHKYAPGFNVLFRFLAAFITFFATNKVIGFNPYLNHAYIAGILAAVSVVFPTQILLFFEVVFIVLHILYVSRYLAFITALIFAILYFIYVRFIPKDGYVILSMPVLSSFGVPYVVPVLLGVMETPLSIIPEAIGVVIYFFLQNVITVVSTSTEDTINLYYLVMQQTFDGIFGGYNCSIFCKKRKN